MMAKSTGKLLPTSYKNISFPETDAYENLLYLYPLTSGSISVGQQAVKIQFEIPNLLALKLDDIWIECYYTPTFTSTNGGDTFSTVKPSFVPWRGPSSIERMTLKIGSSVAFDYYSNNLLNNIIMNLQNNALTRNNYQFMGGEGQFQGTATPQPMFTRFKLRYSPLDQINQSGVLPLEKMSKMILELYYTPASFCMYYAGTALGTITLGYTIDNLQLQIREIASPTLNNLISTSGLTWCSREWYHQSLALGLSARQSVQVPCNFKYVRGLVFVLRRLQDMQDITPTGINKLVEYSPDVSNIVALNVKINGVKRQLQDFQNSYEWLYELKRLFPASETCDYFIESKIGPTAANPGNTTVRTIYGLLVGRSYDTATESGIDTGGISSAINIDITWTNNLVSNNMLEVFILHDRWIEISPSGATLLKE